MQLRSTFRGESTQQLPQQARNSPVAQALRTCDGCRHCGVFFTRTNQAGVNDLHVTCRAPVEAGLSRVFEIAYPRAGYARTCPAFIAKAVH